MVAAPVSGADDAKPTSKPAPNTDPTAESTPVPSAAPPTAPGGSRVDEIIQFPVTWADPVEVANIIRSTIGIQRASGSSSAGVVVMPSWDVDLATRDLILRTIQKIDVAARERQWAREVQEEDRMRAEAAHREKMEEERRAEEEKKFMSIDYMGGTVGEYLDAVSKAGGVTNIVIGTDSISALRMPAVKVKRVTGTAAVLLLQSLRFTSGANEASLHVELVSGDPDGVGASADSVMVIDYVPGTAPRADSAGTRVEVFDLSAYQRHDAPMVTQIMDALKVAVSMQGVNRDFKLSLHEGTGLLFARGNSDDLEIVARTLQSFVRSKGGQEAGAGN